MYRRNKQARLLTNGIIGVSNDTTLGDEHWNDVNLLLDGSSPTNDISTVNQDASITNVGSVASGSTAGPSGFGTLDALGTNGTSQYLHTSYYSSTTWRSDFTIEGWFYIDSTQPEPYPCLWGHRSVDGYLDGNKRYGVQVGLLMDGSSNNQTFFFQIGDGSTTAWLTDAGGLGSVTTNGWQHVALTRSGNTFRLFKDGVQIGTGSTTGTVNATGNFAIMAGTQAGTQELEGKVFDFRVTKGVARYTGNFTPTTQSLPTALATLRTRGYVGAAPLAADTFATLDPDDIRDMSTLPGTSTNLGTGSLSEGNYQFNDGSDVRYQGAAFSTSGKSSGKWYVEFRGVGRPGFGLYDGVRNSNDLNHQNYSNQVNQRPAINGPGRLFSPHASDLYRWGTDAEGGYPTSFSNNTTQFKAVNTNYGTGWSSGDIVGMAFDLDNGTVEYFLNGTSQGEAFSDLLSSYSSGNDWYVAVSDVSDADTYTYVNFGQPNGATFGGTESPSTTYTDANGLGEFYYEPPAGFVGLYTTTGSNGGMLTLYDRYVYTITFN